MEPKTNAQIALETAAESYSGNDRATTSSILRRAGAFLEWLDNPEKDEV